MSFLHCHLIVLLVNLERANIYNFLYEVVVFLNVLKSSILMFGIQVLFFHAQYRYFVTFIDNDSHFKWAYVLHSKTGVFNYTIVTYVDTQISTYIKILCSYYGGEYIYHVFQYFL